MFSSPKKPASRLDELTSQGGAMWALARARELEAQGKEIIHLEIGEPDLLPPAFVVDEAAKSMRNGRARYGPSAGILPFRQTIADYLSASRDCDISPDNILITHGVKSAIFFTLLSLTEPGDEIIYPDPGFPQYEIVTRFAGGVPIAMPLRPANRFLPDLEELRSLITPRTKAIILNSPGNPTGAIFPMSILEGIAELALEHQLWVISDEIYSELYYTDTPPPSIYTLSGMAERVILMDGFSKTFAMTGWRMGYGVFPDSLVNSVASALSNNHSCLPVFIQDAGIVALQRIAEWAPQLRTEFKARRDLVVEGIAGIPGLKCDPPDGTFYAMIDARQAAGEDIVGWLDHLLDAGISMIPATTFGEYGTGYARLAFTRSQETLQKAIAGIRHGVENPQNRAR